MLAAGLLGVGLVYQLAPAIRERWWWVTPGAVLALTFFPLHRRLTDALAGRDGLSAALLTVTLVVVVVVPTILFGSVILAQAGTLYQRLSDAFSHGSTAIEFGGGRVSAAARSSSTVALRANDVTELSADGRIETAKKTAPISSSTETIVSSPWLIWVRPR